MHPNEVDVIEDGTVDAVVNTVTGDREVLQDGFGTRRAAVESLVEGEMRCNEAPPSCYLAGG